MSPLDNPQARKNATPDTRSPAGSDQPPALAKPKPVLHAPAAPASPPAIAVPTPERWLPVVDPLLFVHVTAHTDIERIRIASENRLRILTTTEADDDGVMRGFGLDESQPDVARLQGITEALVALEHGATLNLKRALRSCGIHPWVKAQKGLGEKQVARLLGAIGDPYWHLAEDRPRTVSELWAYSGLHVLPSGRPDAGTHHVIAAGAILPADHFSLGTQENAVGGNQTSDPGPGNVGAHDPRAGVAARRRKGVQANWSTEAKMRAYLCATSCLKQAESPYRVVYLARREHTATTHPDWTPGHSHNDGLRIASKAILRDLWRESKRLHQGGASAWAC